MMTAAQQVAHVAQTIGWFVEGASGPEGFDLDFERHAKELEAVSSLHDARKALDAAYGDAIAFLNERTDAQLLAPLPEGPVMGGAPVSGVFWGIVEHTAHHRGALTVYARLLGKVPPMPYGG
jgi:uncharacterized damage-inducible protein DinB